MSASHPFRSTEAPTGMSASRVRAKPLRSGRHGRILAVGGPRDGRLLSTRRSRSASAHELRVWVEEQPRQDTGEDFLHAAQFR